MNPAHSRRAPTLAACGCLLFLVGGCASAPSPKPSTPGATGGEAEVSRVRAELEAQTQRIGELEARLSLLEEEARRSRSAGKPERTVRIGSSRRQGSAKVVDAEADLAEEAERSNPVLRLTGRPKPRPVMEPLTLPSPPPGVEARLPVVPLPEQRGQALLASTAGSDEQPDPASEYKQALALLTARHFDEALAAFSRFMVAHPASELIDRAHYWRGEAHYALRHYGEARRDFEAVVTRFPTSAKGSDSLLKLALCHRHLGDEAQAESYFERVRQKYPNSDAARVASREGSS